MNLAETLQTVDFIQVFCGLIIVTYNPDLGAAVICSTRSQEEGVPHAPPAPQAVARTGSGGV